MKQLHILNSREARDVLKKIEEQYGCLMHLDYSLLMDHDHHVFILHPDAAAIDFDKIRINSVGLYFAEVTKNGEIRLTLEGSQIVGPHARKNIVELTEAQARNYFRGEEVKLDVTVSGAPFLLLKLKDDFFGAAKYKDGLLLNYLPKYHRTKELIL